MEICPGCKQGHLKMVKSDLLRLTDKTNLKTFMRYYYLHLGFQTVMAIRLCSHVYNKGFYRLAGILRIKFHARFGIDIVPGAKIGFGLRLEHPTGIVIGRGVIIGENLTIMHNVTIGQKHILESVTHKSPQIGSNVTIGCGAVLLGGMKIKNNTIIKAGSFLVGKD